MLYFLSIIITLLEVSFSNGIPQEWQLGFQEAATPVMEKVVELHNHIMWVLFIIGVFVTALIAYVVIKFRESKNKIPSKRTHNTVLEIIWITIPVIILAWIMYPSVKLIHYMEKTRSPELTLKVIGRQWYWTYIYPDHNIEFDSNIIPDDQLKPGQPRLLTVNHEVVIPVNTNVRVLLTSSDVLHSWAIPAFGIKKDTVPGKLNETWFNVKKEGIYYGQCSELCGSGHGYMPITIRVVSKEEFNQWLDNAKKKFSSLDFLSPKISLK